ncbi:MAG: ribonuclease D [Slackia sp.]|nr:ribonuclease D [Slackia sp.]
MYITDQRQLKEFVSRAKTSPILAVDTEFLREKTYWPKLCLIQLATEEESVAVDPFRVKDLSALADLFVDEKIVKLFHAAGQDMELIAHEMGVIPRPVFDTQIAASLLGDTLQIGYGSLVMNECNVKLKKADSFTDWSRRPLTDSQLEYALDDVIYLPRIYHSMKARLEQLGRLSWLDPDFEELCDPERYRVDPYERFKRLKRVNQLTPRQLSAAREVAAWREEAAMKRNVPRKWILTDEQIVEVCKREPRSLDELFMVRGVSNALKTDDARRVLAACKQGLDAPEEAWPELNKAFKSEPNVDPQVDLLYSLVKVRAKEAGVAFGVLASHADLAKLVRGHYDEVDILKGWRRHLVGEELLRLMRGEIVLGIEEGVLKVTDRTR